MNRKRLAMMMFMLWSWGTFASVVAAAEPESVSVKDLIRRVSQDLIESQIEREQSGQNPLFKVETLTIEINFVVTTTTEVGGGIDLKVVTVEGGKQYENQQVQKITLQLSAIPDQPGGLPKREPTRPSKPSPTPQPLRK